MIVILKPKYLKFRRVCWFCGCEYEYELGDVDSVRISTTCPCCKKSNDHDAENFGWEREADNEQREAD